MVINQITAYQAGIDGHPEPAKVFKQVRMVDDRGEVMEGEVETEASVRNRLAWLRGTEGPFRLFERWIAGRLESLDRRVQEMNARAGNVEWLEGGKGDSGYGLTSNYRGISPASIHGDAK